MSAKSGGIVEVVAVREGTQVAKGDLIAQIGAADIEARLAQAKAAAEAAEAQLAQIDTAIEQARLGTAVARGTLAHGVRLSRVAGLEIDRPERLHERCDRFHVAGHPKILAIGDAAFETAGIVRRPGDAHPTGSTAGGRQDLVVNA